MIYLIGTSSSDVDVIGRVLSCHRTVEGACTAERRMTRAMGKATEDCFYPMIVARGKGRRNEGARVVAGTVDVLDVTLEREHARQNEAEHGRR